MLGYQPDTDSEDELPPEWEEKATEDGQVYYIDRMNKTSQLVHPRTGKTKRVSGDLPIGWKKIFDESLNKSVFLNTKNQQRTLIDPRLAFAVEEPTDNIAEVRQRFDASTKALQILHGIDLAGRLAIVTGCNTGIGFETARSLALHGCEVIFACRNQKATEEAIKKIASEKKVAGRRCRFMYLDLGSLITVQNFVKQVKKTVRNINYLILNAGVFALPYSVSEDGIETTFQVCHLSHFYLTLELDTLFSQGSRIVVVSSESHRFAKIPTDNLTEEHLSLPPQNYWSIIAYNNAKLCNVLFAQHLGAKWQHRGISVFALHPGNMVSSYLSRNWWFYRILFALVRPFTKSLQQAASTTIYCATARELTSFTGLYFNNCYFCEPSELCSNEQLRERVWQLSEQMIQKILAGTRSIY